MILAVKASTSALAVALAMSLLRSLILSLWQVPAPWSRLRRRPSHGLARRRKEEEGEERPRGSQESQDCGGRTQGPIRRQKSEMIFCSLFSHFHLLFDRFPRRALTAPPCAACPASRPAPGRPFRPAFALTAAGASESRESTSARSTKSPSPGR